VAIALDTLFARRGASAPPKGGAGSKDVGRSGKPPRAGAPGRGMPAITAYLSDGDAYDRSIKAFRRFDQNGDGVISRQELARVFKGLDPDAWTDERIDKLMDAADGNSDGTINYEEFVAWLMGTEREWEADRAAACLKGDRGFHKEGLVVEHRSTKHSAETVFVQVNQEDGVVGKLGIQVDASDGKTLRITQLKPGGFLNAWNSQSPLRQIQVGDTIVEINGIRDNSKLLAKELKKKVLLDIAIEPSEKAVCFLQKVSDFYVLQRTELAMGTYSIVRRGTRKSTDIRYAVKSMHKRATPKQILDSMVKIMKPLDHPNIAKLYDVFEDHLATHLVTELCEGGELLQRILVDTNFTERQAARVMRQVFAAVAYLHSLWICHREVRPEHVLLLNNRPTQNAVIKLVDFRSAREFDEDTQFTDRVNQTLFAAPEVLSLTGHNETVDMWACGVIMYLAISGYPPFAGEVEGETVGNVLRGALCFPDDWVRVSQSAKDLILALLEVSPTRRAKAHDALKSEWIEDADRFSKSIDFPLHEGQRNMKAFVGQNRLRKAAAHAIAQRMGDEEIKELQDMFSLLDKNGDKMLTFYELKAGLDRLGQEETLRDLQIMFEAIDVDGSRRIDYTEFLAAALDRRRQREDSACWAAFQVFDTDGSGTISKQELVNVLGDEAVKDMMNSTAISRVLQDCDMDRNGSIDFHEFMEMMRADSA